MSILIKGTVVYAGTRFSRSGKASRFAQVLIKRGPRLDLVFVWDYSSPGLSVALGELVTLRCETRSAGSHLHYVYRGNVTS